MRGFEPPASASRTQESNDVFVVLHEGYGKSVDNFTCLLRLNTKTGASTSVVTPDYATRWLFDQDGTPRIAVTSIGKRRAVHFNDPAIATWRKLAEFDVLSDDALNPVWYGVDHTLYVQATNGQDKAAIYRYDLAAAKILP